ncbi:CpaF family protein [Candidatus Bealeia paramacronuclearis]|uniref:CpaF family protein n=1 Tax=Candidatus Bealeia paramacronuclearis TaxID=1921001 RepID=A0ABZ2C5C8_9PROT|nr:CpaF family protein [Candidatus Bealeia paramacronuclearis]
MAIFGKKQGSDGTQDNASEEQLTQDATFYERRATLRKDKGEGADNRDIYSAFRKSVHLALMDRIDLFAASKMRPDELRHEVEVFVADFAAENNVQLNIKEQLLVANLLVDDMIGLGPLEELLNDESVTDIMVNGPKNIFVERKGKLRKTPVVFHDEAHLVQVSQRIANRIGRRVDEASPMVDARLADGSRVNIIMPPLALDGTSISIRKFAKQKITLEKMAEQGNLSHQMCTFLKVCAACRLNTLVSGGTGSGKTTLLNAMSRLIDPGERIVTVEDSAELQLQQPHVVRLESRPPNIEGTGEITIRDLVRNALRMRPDRIVIGEVRGAETVDMLQAMNTGHDGSMSTIHANRPREVLTRLENMINMAGWSLPTKVVRAQIVGAVNLIVHTERMRDGKRRVTQISEITGIDEEIIMTQDLFIFDFEGEEMDPDSENVIIKGNFRSTGLKPFFTPRARYFNLEKELMDSLHEGP